VKIIVLMMRVWLYFSFSVTHQYQMLVLINSLCVLSLYVYMRLEEFKLLYLYKFILPFSTFTNLLLYIFFPVINYVNFPLLITDEK